MKTNYRVSAWLSALLLLGACSSSNNDGGFFSEVPPAAELPAPPMVNETQIDRMGRAAITSALISPLAESATRGADRDAYNAAAQSDWPMFSDSLAASMAVFDSLDAVCGNQLLADSAAMDASRYATLAGAFADDRLYLNSASGSCNQYFGVELNATGVLANDDCGGRTPLYDVIDVSYTALSNDLSVAVGDGVAADNVTHTSNSFPYLAAFEASPAPPAVAMTQIDRMGRAAITSALISPIADETTRGTDRDNYNAATQANWADFSDNIRANLAVYDSLDASCGNQFLADGMASDASRYDTLTGALIDDRLYVNSGSSSCGQYFGVELNATGVVPNDDCGGRTPLYDVIDTTYTAVSNDLTIAVGDGVASDDVVHSASDFPFLAAP